MKILLGTTNPSKVRLFEELLSEYDVEFITPKDLNIEKEPEESGKTPEENAVIKAKFYGSYFDSVICNDSGLYIDNLDLEDQRQPGLYVRTPNGVRLNDEEMIVFYSNLAKSFGGKVLSYYLNAFAVYKDGVVSSFQEDRKTAREKTSFYLVDKVHEKRCPGWPLDSISINFNTGMYYVEEDYIENIYTDNNYTEDTEKYNSENLSEVYSQKVWVDFFVEKFGLKEK